MTYLGSTIDENWDHSLEIRCRIEQAREAFFKFQKVLKNRDLNLQLRTRILRCYVFSVLLYGVESWTLTEASLRKLEAFEMWCYRRMLRIEWYHFVTNDDVLLRMGKELEIVTSVKTRKLAYFGHVMRNPEKYNLLHLVLQGKICGKRGPGRRRISWLKNLRQWYNRSTRGLFRDAVNKVMVANMIANVR